MERSAFPSQNVQSTPFLDHFWKLTCRKSARRYGAKRVSKSKCTKYTILGPLLEVDMSKNERRCGAKHISKSKVSNTDGVGALLEVDMSKKCTPLWSEARFQVKMYKAHHSWTTFGSWHVEKVHAVMERSAFPSQNVQSTPFLDHFWKLWCRKSVPRCGAKHSQKCNKLRGTEHFWKLTCRKSARRSGAKHIWKSKVSETSGFEPFWCSDVE